MPMDLGSYDTALSLARRGYHVVPIVPRSKAASVKDWTELRLRASDIPNYFPSAQDSAMGCGLLTGTKLDAGCFLVAIDIDVDDPDLIRRVVLAFDEEPPSKVGAKGRTFFVRVPHSMKKKILARKDPVTGQKVNMIELLGSGQQTVLPPSIHPSGKQYEWIGTPLHDYDPMQLPEFNAAVISEINIAVLNPASPLFNLNSMVWAGVDGGGDTHDSCVSAVASMVAYGWTDEQIAHRVLLAKRRAVEEAGDVYDWPDGDKVVAEWIASARDKGFEARPDKVKIHRAVARWLMEEFIPAGDVYNRDGKIAIYKDGAFDLWDSEELRHLIAQQYKGPQNTSIHSPDWRMIVSNVLDLAPRFPGRTPFRRVCMKNGTIDMDTGELGPHQREDYLITRLPFSFEPDAACPVYDKFMADAFANLPDDDTIKSQYAFEEFVAHSFFECLYYHKFLVVKGQPRTGKSTLMQIARMLHGEQGISTVPLHEFGNERYRTAMVGKLLNIVTEVAATSHAIDDFLKAVVAGDEVSVRYLYHEPMSLQLPTRVMVACNEMFRVRDTSGAIEARMVLLACDNFVPEEKRDRRLWDKLRAELPGIFNRMVVAWHRLRDRDMFLVPKSSEPLMKAFTLENNNVLSWIQERTKQGSVMIDPEAQIDPNWPETEGNILYYDYSEWSKLNGFKQMSSTTFGMKLTSIKIPPLDLTTRVRWIGGKAVRVRPLTLNTEGKY